jgi:gliding motility-associated lipoprotein GldH
MKITSLRCIVVVMALGFTACNVKSDIYQKQVAIPSASWSSQYKPVFKVDIKDTAAMYSMYLLFRHDDAYPVSNIWLRMKVKAPGDSLFREGVRIDKTIANSVGEWQGKGIGGIWEEKIPIYRDEMPQFKKIGVYEIQLEHLMRLDPLPAVLNVGIGIEKR